MKSNHRRKDEPKEMRCVWCDKEKPIEKFVIVYNNAFNFFHGSKQKTYRREKHCHDCGKKRKRENQHRRYMLASLRKMPIEKLTERMEKLKMYLDLAKQVMDERAASEGDHTRHMV